jgi:hypothetical protein
MSSDKLMYGQFIVHPFHSLYRIYNDNMVNLISAAKVNHSPRVCLYCVWVIPYSLESGKGTNILLNYSYMMKIGYECQSYLVIGDW